MRWRDISSSPKGDIRPIWMRARSLFERILEALLDRAVVALLVHVDEIGLTDQADGDRGQPQLGAPDLVSRGLQVGLERL